MKTLFFIFPGILLFIWGCNNNPGKTKTEKIDHVFQEAFNAGDFVGNVLIADKGEVIYKKCFGKSDAEINLPNTDSTKFLIASISKPITAILILQLVDEEKLRLNDAVDKYFSVADPKIGKVTVHQLLTHTSGLNEFISKDENMDVSALIKNATLKFDPGSDFDYCNSGYVLLKEIAELTAGEKYESLVNTHIFQPAQMTASGVARNSTLNVLARGYSDMEQTQLTGFDFPVANLDGAGSIYSTTGDLYKLDRALYGNELLSEKMKSLMHQQHVNEKFGYGWFIRDRGGVWDVYYHKGDLPGFTGFICRRIQHDRFIVLLSNIQNVDLSDIDNDIASILRAD
jgi:CubicO group peptidase (beta-lactamase class C family)